MTEEILSDTELQAREIALELLRQEGEPFKEPLVLVSFTEDIGKYKAGDKHFMFKSTHNKNFTFLEVIKEYRYITDIPPKYNTIKYLTDYDLIEQLRPEIGKIHKKI